MMNNKNSIENGNGKSEKYTNETMLSYTCPTCSHLLGKQEFEKVIDKVRRTKEEESKKLTTSSRPSTRAPTSVGRRAGTAKSSLDKCRYRSAREIRLLVD